MCVFTVRRTSAVSTRWQTLAPLLDVAVRKGARGGERDLVCVLLAIYDRQLCTRMAFARAGKKREKQVKIKEKSLGHLAISKQHRILWDWVCKEMIAMAIIRKWGLSFLLLTSRRRNPFEPNWLANSFTILILFFICRLYERVLHAKWRKRQFGRQ